MVQQRVRVANLKTIPRYRQQGITYNVYEIESQIASIRLKEERATALSFLFWEFLKARLANSLSSTILFP
jgi:hypothetical protein